MSTTDNDRETVSRSLETLFPELSRREFLETSWPQGRYRVSHGPPSRLAGLCEEPRLQDIERVLAAHKGETRVVFTDSEGKYCQSYVEPQQARTLYRGGMTVCLTHLHRSLPLVDAWVRALEKDLGLPPGLGQCNAYVSPPGKGFSKHFDNREVLVLQLQGSKTWWVQENREVAWPSHNYVLGENPPPVLAAYFEGGEEKDLTAPIEEVHLEPGSALYLPRGTWHATDAAAHSLSLTFGFFPPSHLEVLLDGLAHRLMAREAWRRPVGALWGDGPQLEGSKRRMATLLTELAEDLASWDAEELLLRFNQGTEPAGPAGRRLERQAGARLDAVTANGTFKAVIEGVGDEILEVEVEEEMVPMLRWLAAAPPSLTLQEANAACPTVAPDLVAGFLDFLEQVGYLAQRS